MANITSKIQQTFKYPNIAASYGPYQSKHAAHVALADDDLNIIGMTVGIEDSTTHTIKEWWYQGGTTEADLVEKQAAEIPVDQTVQSGSPRPVAGGAVASALEGKAPSTNIQKTALSSDIQQSLDKADNAIPSSQKGANSGVATLDENGKLPSSQLPLGETSSTAFAGDRGKAIEDKIPSGASSSNKLVTTSDLSEKVDKVSGATQDNFASFDANGGIKNSNCNEGTFIKGVKKGTETLTPVNGVVTVPSDIESAHATSVASNQSATATIDSNHILQLEIPRGADAVSPFKGWYDAVVTGEAGSRVVTSETQNLPANPVVGDYAYVKTWDIDTSTTPQTETPIVKIYECTTDGSWSDSGRTADTSNVQTFATGEEVNETPIDDTHLVNPADGALPTAADVLQLKAKLEGVTMEETKLPVISSGEGTNVFSGKVNGADGTIGSSTNYSYYQIAIPQGTTAIRFKTINGTGWTCGYALGKMVDNNFVTNRSDTFDTSGNMTILVESEDEVFRTTCRIELTSYPNTLHLSDFYCYLQSGDTAVTQGQLAEVRNAIPVVESFANKTANNIVLNEDIVKQLSFDEYDKIDVDVSDFNDGLPYSMNATTLKFRTNDNYKHVGIYATSGDIIEINGGEVGINFYFLTSLEYSNGGDIPIVAGTEPILVQAGSRCTLQAPIGTKCIAFYYRDSSNNTFVPQSFTIYRKKSSYDSKVYTADDYIMCNFLSASSGNIALGYSYSKCFVIPIKAGFKYALMLSNVGTGTKLLYYLNRLPNIGDSYDDTILGWYDTPQSNIATTFTPTYDGFLNISFRNTSYTADNISLVAVKSIVDMSDFVAPMLSKLKFNTPQYTVKSGGIYAATNKQSGLFTTSNNYKHILLKVVTNDIVVLKKGTNVIRYAYLKNDTLVNETLANFADGTGPMVSNSDVLEIVPPTANYLYIQNSYSSTSYLPSYIGILADNTNAFTDDMQNRRDYNIAQATSVGLSKLNVQVDENGWELPLTLQQLNAQKKAEQLCKIKWTPKYNVPSKISPYYYDANVEQTSIPYSSNNDDGSKTVGEEVTLHTYMTAVNNPFSLMYTECVCKGNGAVSVLQKSAWGKIYTKSSNGYAYYGTVCCGLTSSVENAPLKWNNPTIRNYLKTNGLYIQICPTGTVDFNLLQIGDVADNTSHSFLVYGLHRDANGNVDKVKISESSSGHGRGKCVINNGENRDNFISRVYKNGSNPFTLFRYAKLWNNTDYEQSEYVPLTDRGETATEVTYNDAICTFAGDKATFRAGDLVVINYNLNGTQPHDWTKIKVYKDDVLLGEYTLAEAEATLEAFYTENGEDTSLNGFNVISQHSHALVLGTELAAGMYKACMSDGTNDSDFTYWEIIPNTITVVEQGHDSYKVSVSGGFLEAIYVGNAYYLPTYDEQATNEFIIHPIALMQAWGLAYDGIDVRVKLKGEYGSVTTVGATVIEGDAPEPEPEPDDNDDTNP